MSCYEQKAAVFVALISLFLLFFFLCGVSAACSNQKPRIFNFGDGISDTGGYALLMGIDYAYPDGRAYFHHPTAGRRLCDGRLLLDFLCENLSRTYLTPYMEPMDYFSMGANFALSSSLALENNSDSPFSLDVQLHQFTHFYTRSVHLRSTGDKNFLERDDFEIALYTFDIGQRDLMKKFNSSLGIDEVLESVPPIISRIKSAIQTIYQLGGKHFWVHNTGPLGCLPKQLGEKKPNASEVDQYGCITSMNEAAKDFNTELDVMCQELRFQLYDSTIVYVDVYSIKYNLIAHASSYGFEHPLTACCGYGGPPYNYDPNLTCEDEGHDVCGEGSPPYISWDGIHYTEAANAIVASQILSTKYSSPPLQLDFFCNST